MRPTVHEVLSLSTVVLLCMSLSACGSRRVTGSTFTSTAIEAAPIQNTVTGDYDSDDYNNVAHSGDGDNDDSKPQDRDNDSDNTTGSYYDRDDTARRFGHAARASDKQAITALVRRYYAAAVAEDGAAGCSMIIAAVAKSVPEDLGRPPGPPYLRGTTCPAVVSKLFKQNRRQLAAYATALEVTSVRVEHDNGVAILGFKALPGRQVRLAREGGVWRFEALLDSELP
jgi:hypothetical protein